MMGFSMKKNKISLVIVMQTTQTPQISMDETLITRELLMKKVRFEEKSNLHRKFKDSSNFNKGNVYYEGILNGKQQD